MSTCDDDRTTTFVLIISGHIQHVSECQRTIIPYVRWLLINATAVNNLLCGESHSLASWFCSGLKWFALKSSQRWSRWNFHQSLALLLIFNSNFYYSLQSTSPYFSVCPSSRPLWSFGAVGPMVLQLIWTLNDGYLIIQFIFLSSRHLTCVVVSLLQLFYYFISPETCFVIRSHTFYFIFFVGLISVFVLISSTVFLSAYS